MTQAELNRALAHATGEPVSTIAALGFSVADPWQVAFDPELCARSPQVVDWDALDAQRDVVFPTPRAVPAKRRAGRCLA